MVVTCLPPRSHTCTLHDRVGSPSRCTVQAPHWAIPHPNFVPVSLRCSRSTQSNGVSGSASTLTSLPLTVNAMATMHSSLGSRSSDAGFSAMLARSIRHARLGCRSLEERHRFKATVNDGGVSRQDIAIILDKIFDLPPWERRYAGWLSDP